MQGASRIARSRNTTHSSLALPRVPLSTQRPAVSQGLAANRNTSQIPCDRVPFSVIQSNASRTIESRSSAVANVQKARLSKQNEENEYRQSETDSPTPTRRRNKDLYVLSDDDEDEVMIDDIDDPDTNSLRSVSTAGTPVNSSRSRRAARRVVSDDDDEEEDERMNDETGDTARGSQMTTSTPLTNPDDDEESVANTEEFNSDDQIDE